MAEGVQVVLAARSRDRIEALAGELGEGALAEDIANALVYAFAQPANVNIHELLVMPTRQTIP